MHLVSLEKREENISKKVKTTDIYQDVADLANSTKIQHISSMV